MTDRQDAPLSSRKTPRQARSTALVTAVLEAAAQVLARDGAHRFTTARVAETAGVSVGSLYQYFPNKAAILFRLQRDEWERTTGLLRRILADVAVPPTERLRTLVRAFVRSECEETATRTALADAAPFYRDAPEACAAKRAGADIVRAFVDESLPRSDEATRLLAADLIGTALSRIGKHCSDVTVTPAVEAAADALADMLCAYLDTLVARDRADRGG